MPLPAAAPLAPSLENAVRLRLMASLYAEHRPELADLVASAELQIAGAGLWVRPESGYAGLNPAWLEPRLFAAAVCGGLPVEWIRVLGTEVRAL